MKLKPFPSSVIAGTAGGFYTLATLSLAGTVGLDTSPLLAGGAITGLTVGFAAREVAANYISGVMLVLTRPFSRGDYIVLGRPMDELAGVVEKTDMRYVYLRPRGSARTLLVPNSVITKTVVAVVDRTPVVAPVASPPAVAPVASPPVVASVASPPPQPQPTLQPTPQPQPPKPAWRNPAPPIERPVASKPAA